MSITFSHVDLFVEDTDSAVKFYEKLGFARTREFEVPNLLKANFVEKDGRVVGLLQNLTESPFEGQVSVVNHLVFMMDDREKDGTELEAAGVTFFPTSIEAPHGTIYLAKGKNGEIMEFFVRK